MLTVQAIHIGLEPVAAILMLTDPLARELESVFRLLHLVCKLSHLQANFAQ